MATNWDDFTVADAAPSSSVDWSQFTPAAPAAPKQNKGTLGDLGTDLKRGIEGLPGLVTGIADIPAGLVGLNRPADRAANALGELTGFRPSQWAKDAEQEYSPNRQAANRDIAQAWDTGGALDIASAYARNPGATVGNIVESVPGMAAGGVIGKGLAVAGKVAPMLAGAIGEGTITAGSAMDQTDRAADPTKAALSSVAAGAGTAAIGLGAGKAASKFGLTDVDELMAGGKNVAKVDAAGKLVKPMGLPKRVAASMAQEGLLEELPQSMQEQAWQNVAEGKPIGEGVARAGVEGALAGAAMGGGMNLKGPNTAYATAISKAQDTIADHNAPFAERQKALDFLKDWKENNHDAAVATEWYQGIQESLIQDQMARDREQAAAAPVDMLAYGGLIVPKRKGDGEQIGLNTTEEVADEWRGPKAQQDEEAPGASTTVGGFGIGENTVKTESLYGTGGVAKGTVRPITATEPVDMLNTNYGGLTLGKREKGDREQIPLPPVTADAPVGSGAGVGANQISTANPYGNGSSVSGTVRPTQETAPAPKAAAKTAPPAAPTTFTPTPAEVQQAQDNEPTVAPVTAEQRLQEDAKVVAPAATAVPAVSLPKNVQLTDKQKPVFEYIQQAMENNQQDEIVDAEGVLQYQKIADKFGIARGSAKSFIDRIAQKMAVAAGKSLAEMKTALRERAVAQRSVAPSDMDTRGLSPAMQTAEVNENDLFGSEDGAEQSMGVINSVGGSQGEIGKDEQLPASYVDSVAPSDKAKADAEANAMALFNDAFSDPEAQHAATDWDDTRTDGAPAFAELSTRDQAGWILEYAGIVAQTNDWTAIESAQRSFERDLTDEKDVTERTPAIAGPSDTSADKQRVSGEVRQIESHDAAPAQPETPTNPLEARLAKLQEFLGGKQKGAVKRLIDRYTNGDITIERLTAEIENYRQQVEDGVRFSESQEGGAEAAKVTASLKKLFFSPEKFDKLVRVVQSVSDLQGFAATQLSRAKDPTKVQGFVGTDGKVVLISDNIQPGQELAVFLHEVGVHLGMEKLIGRGNMVQLSRQIAKWSVKNDGSPESVLAKKALDRAKSSSSTNKAEEVLAYFIEEAVNSGIDPVAVSKAQGELASWFRTLWAAAKTALRKLGLNRFDSLTAQDMVNLAYGAAKLEMTGTWHGTAADFRNFNHEFMGKGEGMQAFGWGSYLAQAPGIGYTYWSQDTDRKTRRSYQNIFSYDGKDLDTVTPDTTDADHVAKVVMAVYGQGMLNNISAGTIEKMYGVDHDVAVKAARAAQFLDITKGDMRSDRQTPDGSLMRVDTAVHDNEFLDWDKPMSEQSEVVKAALDAIEKPKLQQVGGSWWQFGDYRIEAKSTMLGGKRFYVSKGFEQGGTFDTLEAATKAVEKRSREIGSTGQEVYKQLQASLGSDKAASEYLDSIGIKGIRFLDANSRSGPDLALLQRTLADAQEELAATTDDARKADLQVEINEIEDEIALAEKKTSNLVIFNDKNIQRVMTEVGADTDRIKFSEKLRKWAERLKGRVTARNGMELLSIGEFGPVKSAAINVTGSSLGAQLVVYDQDLLDSGIQPAKAVVEEFYWDTDSPSEHSVHTNGVPFSASAVISKYRGQLERVAPVGTRRDNYWKFKKGSFSTGELRDAFRMLRDILMDTGDLADVQSVRISRATGVTAGMPSRTVSRAQMLAFSEASTPVREYASKVGGRTARMLVDDAVGKVAKLSDSLSFLYDLVEKYKAKLPAIEQWYKGVQASVSTRKQFEGMAEAIASSAGDLPNGTKAINAFLAESTKDQKWGYDPKFANRKVTVDSGMAAKFARLSKEEQNVVREVFAHGEKMGLLQYEIVKALGIDSEFTSTGKLEGPYAPLKRFGDHIALLKSKELIEAEKAEDTKRVAELKKDPAHYEMSQFDTRGQARAHADDNAGKWFFTDSFEKSKRITKERMPADVLQKVLSAVKMSDTNEVPAVAREAMTKLVTEMYFQSLDEHNARTSGLKRKNMAGFDDDMMRSFLAHARAQAGFLANMKHGGEINDAFYQMQQDAKNKDTRHRDGQDALNTIAEHYAENLNYTETPWQDRIMAGTSAWQLATSVGYHLNNMMQPAMVTVPQLAADFNDYRGAWKQIAKGYATLKETGVSDLKLENVKNEGLRAALQAVSDAGLLDVGMMEDLTQFEATHTGIAGVDKTTEVARKALHLLRKASRFFETMNRVSSATAAYNMAIAANKSQAEAQAYAVNIVRRTQGDASRVNKPMILKKLPKIMGQYKGYQFMMAAAYSKAFQQAFMSADPTTKAIGRRMLAYKLFHTTMAAGALGLPTMNLVALAFAGMGGGDEPEDLERTLREKIGDPALAQLLLHGPLAYFGMDMSAKLGDDKIFSILPYTDVDLSSAAGLTKTAAGAMGPAFSQAGKFADGAGLMKRGEYYKGMEKFLPKGVESGMKAFRIANEGFTLKNGDLMFRPEDINSYALALDALGLPSAELKHMDWVRGQQYEIKRFYVDRTKELEQEYSKASKGGDSATMIELRQDWMGLQSGKDHMRQYFGDVHAELKRQPLSNLMRYPQTTAKRERKLQRAAQTE